MRLFLFLFNIFIYTFIVCFTKDCLYLFIYEVHPLRFASFHERRFGGSYLICFCFVSLCQESSLHFTKEVGV